MLNWVAGEVNSTNIITVDKSAAREQWVKFLEKLTQPACFGNTICYSPIFRLSTGA